MAAKKRAFISFDIDQDDGAKKMLAGQSDLPDSPFRRKGSESSLAGSELGSIG